MLILLPPSETKRPGGSRRSLEIESLSLPSLAAPRERAVDALIALAADPAASARVLRLGPKLADEAVVNAHLRTGPTMPAIDRYTGVLYDALDAPSLPAPARAWLGRNVLVHSAPFGPVGALDRIPAYRLGAGIAVPGLESAKRMWAGPVTEALRAAAPAFVLDLRSESYVALGPIPQEVPSAYVRVTAQDADGVARALNHFNKHAKGALVRELATSRPRVSSREGLLRWAALNQVPLLAGASDDEIELRTHAQ